MKMKVAKSLESRGNAGNHQPCESRSDPSHHEGPDGISEIREIDCRMRLEIPPTEGIHIVELELKLQRKVQGFEAKTTSSSVVLDAGSHVLTVRFFE